MKDERGMVTHLALVVLIIVLLFSGLSLDSANAFRVRFMLQTAADATAHAGIIELKKAGVANVSDTTKNNIRDLILPLANANLTGDSRNTAILSSDVVFGRWNSSTRSFTASNTNVDAVRVVARRSSENANALPTFLLRIAGFESWDIEAESVAFMSTEDCSSVDIATSSVFRITSNNDFYNGFCVKAAGGVDLNNNNYFDDDIILYVADFADIDFNGNTSMSTIVGRGTADSSASLTYGEIFETTNEFTSVSSAEIDTMATNYLNPYWDGQPSYINTAASVIQVRAKDVKYTSFAPGRIYEVLCGGSNGNKAQFFNNSVVNDVVLVADCKIQLGKGSEFEDVVLVSRNTSNKSVYAASQVQLGDDDSCATGGGVTIYTAGDFTSASQLEVYGTSITALGEVQIAASADAIEGLTIRAEGDVTFSAQAQFGSCKDGWSSTADVAYLLVR